MGAADARRKGDATAAQVQLKPWQNADAPAGAKTHNQSFDRSANISPVFLTRPMRGNIFVTVSACSSADRADHGIFHENLIVPVFVSEPGGAFHADVRRDAAQDQRSLCRAF